MGFADIVDQDANVEVGDGGGDGGVVGVAEVFGKVDGDVLGLNGVFGFEVCGDLGEFGFCAGDEDNVVAFGCELESKFFANAIGGASDQGPRAFRCILFNLFLKSKEKLGQCLSF